MELKREKVNIFIAEDNIQDREILKEIFKEFNFENPLRFFSDGEEALRFFADMHAHDLPCVIILDYFLPKLSGLEIVTKLKDREQLSEVPFIIMTSSQDKETIKTCLTAGASGYIYKSPTYEDFSFAVVQQLNYTLDKLTV